MPEGGINCCFPPGFEEDDVTNVAVGVLRFDDVAAAIVSSIALEAPSRLSAEFLFLRCCCALLPPAVVTAAAFVAVALATVGPLTTLFEGLAPAPAALAPPT